MSSAPDELSRQTDAGPVAPGELLRACRERRGLTIRRAADELHLDAWVVEAIEGDRYAALGAPVYARGYLRQYATLLGLSVQDVLERYERLGDALPTPTPIPATVKAPARIARISLGKPLLLAAALVLAAAGVWWTLATQPFATSEDLTASPAPSVTPTSEAAVAQSAVEQAGGFDDGERLVRQSAQTSVAGPATDGAAQVAASSVAAADAPDAAASPQNESESIQLRLQFSEASWTEIYDGEGKRLMFDLGAPGGVRTVSGPPPLRVTLGAASAVSAQVNGEQIVIPRRAGRNATTFMIDESGAVQPGSR
ncbi:MAG: DUF4115 domain-containing protein [Steroidobacteraceae bacterium]|jgi:cytoskeleton protein RodZ|nr:DUF4115 domain-containing protein [Steroidobacteraceae bacterium]